MTRSGRCSSRRGSSATSGARRAHSRRAAGGRPSRRGRARRARRRALGEASTGRRRSGVPRRRRSPCRRRRARARPDPGRDAVRDLAGRGVGRRGRPAGAAGTDRPGRAAGTRGRPRADRPEGRHGRHGADRRDRRDGRPGHTGRDRRDGHARAAGRQGRHGRHGRAGHPRHTGRARRGRRKVVHPAGAPAGGTGAVGDWALDSANGDYYEKTGASSWTLRGNLARPAPARPAATGSQGIQGAAGRRTGSTGSAGTPGSVWRSGAALPRRALGVVGDWYLNDSNGDVYEKTGASAWTLRDNLTGPQGIQGNPGAGAPDATTTTKGSIQLAGDLAGTAAAPQIAAGVIVNADIDGGCRDRQEQASRSGDRQRRRRRRRRDRRVETQPRSDAAAGTASRRTLGTGALQAAPATTRGSPTPVRRRARPAATWPARTRTRRSRRS